MESRRRSPFCVVGYRFPAEKGKWGGNDDPHRIRATGLYAYDAVYPKSAARPVGHQCLYVGNPKETIRLMSVIFTFLGRLHPLIVHLPIGIILFSLLLQWMVEKSPGIKQAADLALGIGVLAAIVSCCTGL